MRTPTVIAAALALTAAVSVPPAVADDTPRCVGHFEYDQIDLGMYRSRVTEIFDVSGWVTFVGDGSYRVSYRTCWAFNEDRIRVTYESTDDFVLGKDVVPLA